MMTRFRSLATTDTLGEPVDELLAGSQQDFPVMDDDQPVAFAPERSGEGAFRESARREGRGFHACESESVDGSDSLNRTVESMHAKQWATLAVTQAGRVVGLLTLENVSEMILINAAISHADAAQA